MPRLRLFAHLREAAGTGSVDVDGATVGAVLDEASARFGDDFTAGLASSRVWVNGDPADAETSVAADDEVAVLPPVSGGAQTAAPSIAIPWAAVVLVVLGGLLFLDPAFFVAAAVGALAVWAWDLAQVASTAGDGVRLPPVLVAIAAGVAAPALLIGSGAHLEGIGIAVGFAVIATFVNGVIDARSRTVVGLGTTLLISVTAAAASASLSLVRLADGGTAALWVLLAVSAVATLAAVGAERVPGLNILDPLSAGAIGAVLAGLVTALILGLAVVPYLLVSMVLALALIAGRALGSLVRTGRVLLIDPAPGHLAGLDGAVLGAATLLPALVLFL
jgi:molybdopterin synthase sulfur carrier subunit